MPRASERLKRSRTTAGMMQVHGVRVAREEGQQDRDGLVKKPC